MLVCLLCWLPYFLYEYPGIMSPDSINQFEQVVSMKPWSNHHPVAHTLCLDFFYHIGRSFTTDINAAISCYTIAQMLLFMAFCIAVLIHTLEQYCVPQTYPYSGAGILRPASVSGGVNGGHLEGYSIFRYFHALSRCTLLRVIRPRENLSRYRESCSSGRSSARLAVRYACFAAMAGIVFCF